MMFNTKVRSAWSSRQSPSWRRVRSGSLSAAAVLSLGLMPACITSPTGAYLNADEAAAMKLKSCPAGLIDDGEDDNSQVMKVEGRDGYWFTFKDTEGTTVEPSGEFQMSQGGPPGSNYAARMTGNVASAGKSLYVGMGFNLKDPQIPYDASKYQGVSFWGKGPGIIRFKTPDVNTHPAGDRCSDCYNDFGVEIYLSEKWTRYTVPFEKMKQQPGWGDPAPEVAKDALFAVQWQYSKPGADFDIMIDNVEFVGCQ